VIVVGYADYGQGDRRATADNGREHLYVSQIHSSAPIRGLAPGMPKSGVRRRTVPLLLAAPIQTVKRMYEL
jgi:hypothetical protein